MPRQYLKPFHRQLERERIQREHPNRTRLTREQREARQERILFRKKKAEAMEQEILKEIQNC